MILTIDKFSSYEWYYLVPTYLTICFTIPFGQAKNCLGKA